MNQSPFFKVEFYPDSHPVRNLYLCCSEFCSYSSLTSFNWDGRHIVKQNPIIVGFGGMRFLSRSLPHDPVDCGNQTLSQLNFQMRTSHGDVVKHYPLIGALLLFLWGQINKPYLSNSPTWKKKLIIP